MSEEKEESGMSAVKKAIIGAITTAVTAGGAYFATHLGGGETEAKEETKTEQVAPAPAPVIVNVQQSQENKQQVKQGGGTNTIIKERIIEKPAAPAKTEPAKEEEPW
jgi:hypothetical protein